MAKIIKVENNDSHWNFWDLFNKTANQITKEINKTGAERILIRFLERLPKGDYSNIRNEWNKRD